MEERGESDLGTSEIIEKLTLSIEGLGLSIDEDMEALLENIALILAFTDVELDHILERQETASVL